MLKKDSKILRSYRELESTKKLATLTNVGLVLAVIILLMMVAIEDTVAVVTPPEFNEELRVSYNSANEHYKVRWAFATAAMAGNINANNAKFIISQLGGMLSPYLKETLLPALEREAQIIVARKANQRFIIEDAIYDPQNDVVFIWGHREVAIKQKDPVIERWTYEFRIAPFSGRPAITHFDSYPGVPKSKDPAYQVDYNPTITPALEAAMKTTNPDQNNNEAADE